MFQSSSGCEQEIPSNILNYHLVRSPTRRTCHDGELLNGWQNKAPRVDFSRCSHVKSAWPEESTGSKDRPKSEANRGRDTAKGL
jgi:hypothetical protein